MRLQGPLFVRIKELLEVFGWVIHKGTGWRFIEYVLLSRDGINDCIVLVLGDVHELVEQLELVHRRNHIGAAMLNLFAVLAEHLLRFGGLHRHKYDVVGVYVSAAVPSWNMRCPTSYSISWTGLHETLRAQLRKARSSRKAFIMI